MGSSQQALLMVGEDGFVPPPIPTCVPDPYYSCGPEGDPYWANVVLMLHFDGVDGSTTFTDSSLSAQVSSPTGAASLSIAQTKFGPTALGLPGASTVNVAQTADLRFLSADFTIEGWFYFTSVGGSTNVLTMRNFNSLNGGFALQINNGGWQFQFTETTQNQSSLTSFVFGSVAPPQNQWLHAALVKSGLVFRLFVGGQQVGNSYIASAQPREEATGAPLTIGGPLENNAFMTGFVDDLRITKGIARYTGPFNIPAEAFPDFEGDAGYFDLPRTVLSIHAEINPVSSTLDSFNPSPVNTRTGVTFSNGNKTVAYVSASAINYAAIATRARRSGKYYWEVRLINQGNGTLMGFVRASIARTPGWIQQLQSTPAADPGNGAFYINAGGGTAYQAASGPTVAGAGVNKTYMFAVDFDNAKIWIGIDGVWHNSGNPAAGTNQTLSMTSFVAGFPCVNSNGSFGGGSEFTIRLSDVDVEYSIPTGFSAWATTEDSLNDEYPTDDSSCYQTKLLEFSGQNSAISSAQVKFGSGSLFVPNSGVSTADGTFLLDHQDFDFGTGDFTIECWAYRLANTYEGYLYYATMDGEFSFRVLTTGLVRIDYRVNGNTTTTRVTTVSFPLNQWNFIVIQRRGLNFEFYLNGTLADTVAVSGGATSTVNSTGPWFWGRTNASSTTSWNGHIDEVRVTRGAARYVASFDPASLPNCDSTNDPGGRPVSGTAFLQGESATVESGSIAVQDPWAALSSLALTATPGNLIGGSPDRVAALTGRSVSITPGTATFFTPDKTAPISGIAATMAAGTVRRAPYPGLTSGSTNLSTVVPATTRAYLAVSFSLDGTLTISVHNADGEVFGVPTVTQWIDKSNTNFNISSIAHLYEVFSFNNFGGITPFASEVAPGGSIDTLFSVGLPANLGAAKYVYFVTPNSPPGSPRYFSINCQISWAGTPTNPDYSGSYYGVFRFTGFIGVG
jgi:hypothetical protein